MEYRRIGNSGLRVSAISIGGWLTFGASVDTDLTQAIVDRAVDGGINFIDLADIYARGACEAAVGTFLHRYRRQDLVVSSKVFWPMSDGPNDRGLSRKHIFESVDGSLERLGTDYLDIYFCHRFDPETRLEETCRAMSDLVSMGKVLYWGTSVWTATQIQEAAAICDRRNLHPPIVEQPRYNLLDRSIEHDVMPMAHRLGTGLVVWSPLAGGILTGKYNDGVPDDSRGANSAWLDDQLTEDTIARTRELEDMADELGVTSAQLSLAWALRHNDVASVITGATRAEHVEANLKAAELELPTSVYDHLNELFPA